jgi:hypothetical protein
LTLGTGAALAGPVWAAGAGGSNGGGTGGTGGTGAGAPAGTVVSTTTVQTSGGSATGAIADGTVNVSVPAGAFTVPTQVIITDDSTSGNVAFGIGFYQNGAKVTGSFPAVSCSITSPSITSASTLTSGGATYPSTFVPAHTLDFTITSDPTFAVVTPAALSSTSAIAGATSASTGEPFLGEGLVAAALVVGGGLILLRLRLRRPPA